MNNLNASENSSESDSNAIKVVELDKDLNNVAGEVSIADLNSSTVAVSLLRREIKTDFDGNEAIEIKALFDGGSTNSFIRTSSLREAIRNKINNLMHYDEIKESRYKIVTYKISGATGSTISNITDLDLQLDRRT